MNDDEIKIVKAGAEAAMRPFANLIETLFGGAAEEYGGMWKDSVAARRRIRQVKLMEKTQAIIEKRKIEPQQIPDYIWMPALTAALQQDDESMQERWANLLAAASNPNQEPIPPSFTAMLAEMSPRQARFLDSIFAEFREQVDPKRRPKRIGFEYDQMRHIYERNIGGAGTWMMIDADCLVRIGALRLTDVDQTFGERATNREVYEMTPLGIAFVTICIGRPK